MARKWTSLGAVSDINVTPMVDVMLVLLIIFMVITPMLQKDFSVNLAKATNTRDMNDADKEDAVVLAVSRDGKIYLHQDPIRMDEITQKVKDGISNKLDKTVYVKADTGAKYGVVVSVVDNIRAAGVARWGWRPKSGSSTTCPQRPNSCGCSTLGSARLTRRRVELWLWP